MEVSPSDERPTGEPNSMMHPAHSTATLYEDPRFEATDMRDASLDLNGSSLLAPFEGVLDVWSLVEDSHRSVGVSGLPALQRYLETSSAVDCSQQRSEDLHDMDPRC